jgi:hypothetical protein
MPPPYDAVLSIGGQSLVDGIWHLLGPALEGLSNPLPLTLPGFTNSTMRITRLTPILPGTPVPVGAPMGPFKVLVAVELAAEALLYVNIPAGGSFSISLSGLAGTLGLPDQHVTLNDIAIGGLVPGSGSFELPARTASFTDGTLTGNGTLQNSLAVPGLPLPAVVPFAVNLTPSAPLEVIVSLGLAATGIDVQTAFGLHFEVSDVTVGDVVLAPTLIDDLTTALRGAADQLRRQLHIPALIPRIDISSHDVHTLIDPVANLVSGALNDALSGLYAETGRLLYPPPGTGASCDVTVLPTAGDVQLAVADSGDYVLQVGLGRAGSTDIPSFPSFAPAPGDIADTSLFVGNTFLLELLCCLVQRLSAFALPIAATTGTTDINGGSHLACCNFTNATVNLGPVALGGSASDGLSICIDGANPSPKTFTLVGHFSQPAISVSIPVSIIPPFAGLSLTLPIASITVDFRLTFSFDLDDIASLANLRVSGLPTVTVTVTPVLAFLIALYGLGLLLFGGGGGTVAALLVLGVCAVAQALLTKAVNTVLGDAALVRSPAAIPPGLFEAFGKLVPATVHIDDLTALGVLQTPTEPWSLRPRIGHPKAVYHPRRPPFGNPQQG